MKTRIILVMAMLLFACERRKPAISDAEFNAVKATYPGISEQCLDTVRYKGFSAWNDEDPNCFEMTEPRRWSGMYVTGFEWGNFCPDPATDCPIFGEPGVSWLTLSPNANAPDLRESGLYRIEFIGRRTKVPGHFGHLNQYEHLMVVDRLLALKLVKAQPRE